MRTFLLLMTTLILIVSCNQQNAAESKAITFDEKVETAAMMKTIEAETDCFYRRDYECWKKHSLHADYAFHAWNFSDGTIDARVGWQNVDAKIKAYINEHPLTTGTTSHPLVERRNIITHFFSDSAAYLAWDQYNGDAESKTYMFSKEQRIMEKKDGEWKIVNVSPYWNYKSSIPVDSLK